MKYSKTNKIVLKCFAINLVVMEYCKIIKIMRKYSQTNVVSIRFIAKNAKKIVIKYLEIDLVLIKFITTNNIILGEECFGIDLIAKRYSETNSKIILY